MKMPESGKAQATYYKNLLDIAVRLLSTAPVDTDGAWQAKVNSLIFEVSKIKE